MKKNKSKSKEAKFFCESCGSEVPRNARTCPTCGKFFASVRCPKCGNTGSNDDFKNGCPVCGYAINPESLYGGGSYGNSSSFKNIKNKKSTLIFLNRNRSKTSNGKRPYSDSSLPVWIYIVSVAVLIILIICLYSCL